jgi:hypothetical protein
MWRHDSKGSLLFSSERLTALPSTGVIVFVMHQHRYCEKTLSTVSQTSTAEPRKHPRELGPPRGISRRVDRLNLLTDSLWEALATLLGDLRQSVETPGSDAQA